MTVWLIIMYAAGLVLVLAEFIVPGLICGILGGGLLLASGVLACHAAPEYTVFIVVGELAGLCVAVVAGMLILAKTRTGKRLVLESSQQASAGWVAAESDTALVGAVGEVHTALRPAGTILVDNKRIDAVSDGAFVEKGVRVRVIEVHGSRVVVEPAEPRTGPARP
jgi:membrane-bound serine protease (ClpP class)